MSWTRTLLPLLLGAALAGCATCAPNAKARNGAVIGTGAGLATGYVIAGGGGALVLAAAEGYAGWHLGGLGDAAGPDPSCVEPKAPDPNETKPADLVEQPVDLATLLADPSLPQLGPDLDGDLPLPAVTAATGAAVAPDEAPIPQEKLVPQYLKEADGKTRALLSSDLLFDPGSSYIANAALPVVAEVAARIRAANSTQVQVLGFTDNSGSDDYNVWLSNRRAQRVAEQLQQELGDAVVVISDGRGPRDPRGDNNTEAGRKQNRRMEILF